MKRCRASCGILVCLFAFIVDNSAPALPLYTVSSTPYEVIITIKDYPDSLRILQITDSHISRLPLPDNEMQYAAYARRMNAAYNAKDSVLHFEKIVHVAVKGRYDFIALTGDIINNPSRVSLLYVKSAVDATNIPYFYISGNHDWNYEGLSTDIVSQRDEWQKKVLYPLYSEKNPLFYSSIIKGIKFIYIDDTVNQISENQVAFMKTELDGKYPIILFMHIPIYVPQDTWPGKYTIGNPKTDNTRATLDFIDIVTRSDSVLAIFAGHTHDQQDQMISPTVYQFITGACVYGKYRTISINGF